MREDTDRFTELGARIVAIAPEGQSALARYAARGPFPFPIVGDVEHRTFDAYDVASRALSLGQRPAVFVVDTHGIVRFDSIGTQQWQIPTNDAVLDVLREIRET